MVFYSRRSILRTSAVSVGVLAAGCSTEKRTDSQSDDDRRNQSSSRDEILPPGSPLLEPNGEWPLPRFDTGNTASNPDGTGMQTGTEYWRLTVNGGGPATVANGTLYNTARIRDQDGTYLTCRNPATAGIETSSRAGRSATQPIVTNNRVFVTSGNSLFCFDSETGKQQWRRFANREIVSRPMVHDGIVLINIGISIHAYDTVSGDELWQYKLWQYNMNQDSNSIPAVGGNRVFISSGWGLHAIEFLSGNEVYTVPGEMDSGETPVYHGQTIYVMNSNNELIAANASDGTIRWRIPVQSVEDPPVVTRDVVYIRTADEIIALDSEDGSIISSGPSKVRRLMGLVGDVLYGIGSGDLFALDVANDLRQLWTLSTGSVRMEDVGGPARVSHVTPIDGAVYMNARDGFYGVGPRAD